MTVPPTRMITAKCTRSRDRAVDLPVLAKLTGAHSRSAGYGPGRPPGSAGIPHERPKQAGATVEARYASLTAPPVTRTQSFPTGSGRHVVVAPARHDALLDARTPRWSTRTPAK